MTLNGVKVAIAVQAKAPKIYIISFFSCRMSETCVLLPVATFHNESQDGWGWWTYAFKRDVSPG